VVDIALMFHLLGAFLLAAGTVLAGVAFEAARRRNEPQEIALLLGLTRIGVLLVAPGALLVLAFGLWLVDLGDWGYGSGWVVTALVLFALMAVAGAAGGRRPKRAPSGCAIRTKARRPSSARCSTTERPSPRITSLRSSSLRSSS
jgi:Predicted integral membrane protein (DUF2269)